MDVKKVKNGSELVVNIVGRLDTNTAPELEPHVDGFFEDDVETLIFDFSELEYVSSAGLRVILVTSKRANSSGVNFKIRNVKEEIMEVFEITGFLDIINVE